MNGAFRSASFSLRCWMPTRVALTNGTGESWVFEAFFPESASGDREMEGDVGDALTGASPDRRGTASLAELCSGVKTGATIAMLATDLGAALHL